MRKYCREFYQLLLKGSQAHARWELEMSTNIMKSRKRQGVLFLLLLPVRLSAALPLPQETVLVCPGRSAAKMPICRRITPT
jgi:hypothetical protein